MTYYEKALNDFRQRLAKNGVYTYGLDVPITTGNRQLLEEVAAVLDDSLDGYCACQPKTPASLGHKCSECEKREMLERLRRLFEPVHRTLHPDRLGSVAEAIYFRRWVQEQETSPAVNGGRGTLENVLSPTRLDRTAWEKSTLSPVYTPPVSQRDAEVAATLIQWLGTSCGRGFVWGCEREIASASEERQQFERLNSQRARLRWAGKPDDSLPAMRNLAEMVASQVVPPDKPQWGPLADLICTAFDTFLQGLASEVQVVPCGDGWEPVGNA